MNILVPLSLFITACSADIETVSDDNLTNKETKKKKSEKVKNGIVMHYNQSDTSIIDSVIYYDEGSKLLELDKNDFYVYQDTLFGEMNILVPKYWKKRFHKEHAIYSYNKVGIKKGDFIPSFTVEKHKLELRDIDEFVNLYIETLKEKYGDIKLHKTSRSIINNFNEARIFNCTVRYNNSNLGMIFSFFRKDEIIYLFSGIGENNYQFQILYYAPLYEEIIWSSKHKS